MQETIEPLKETGKAVKASITFLLKVAKELEEIYMFKSNHKLDREFGKFIGECNEKNTPNLLTFYNVRHEEPLSIEDKKKVISDLKSKLDGLNIQSSDDKKVQLEIDVKGVSEEDKTALKNRLKDIIKEEKSPCRVIEINDKVIIKPEDIDKDKLMNFSLELKERLRVLNVPCKAISEGVLLIKTEDIERVKSINREMLIERSCYLQEVTKTEYENIIAERFKNKDVFQMDGLNVVELEILKNKCNSIKKGFTLGVEHNKEADTYSVIVKESDVLAENSATNKNFCKAYGEMILSLYGPNQLTRQEEIEADLKLDRIVAERKGEGNYWIASTTDRHKYIEVSDKGFEVYTTQKKKDGTVGFVSKEFVSVEDQNYEEELYRQLDIMEDKAVVENFEDLNLHLNGQDVLDTVRPLRTQDQIDNSAFQKEFVDILDKETESIMQKNGLLLENAYEKFDNYKGTFVTVMEACVAGEANDIVSSEVVDKVADLAEKYHVNLEDYSDCVSYMQMPVHDISEHKAEKSKIDKVIIARDGNKKEKLARKVNLAPERENN